METISIKVPEYPYDEFVVELDREGNGALWRENYKITSVSRTWNGWKVENKFIKGALTDEVITAAIDKAIAEGKLFLTRVPELVN